MKSWALPIALAVSIALGSAGLARNEPTVNPKDAVSKLYADGEFAEATALAKQQLKAAFAKHGPQSLEAAFWFNQRGLIDYAHGHYFKAAEHFTSALTIRKVRLKPNHADIATSTNNVALTASKLGLFKQAEQLFKESHRINLIARGPRHSFTITNISNLGLLYMDLGRLNEAERLLSRALNDTMSTQGEEADNTATSLSNLATLYTSKLEFAKAEPLLLKALKIDQRHHGEQHPLTAITLNNLGQFYVLKGDRTRAEQHFLQAVAIDNKFLGEKSPAYAVDLIKLAALYQQSARLNEARNYLSEAFEILTHGLASEPRAVASAELGRTLMAQGRNTEARALFHRAIAQLTSIYGAEHHAIEPILADLAMLSMEEDNWREALAFGQNALAIAKKTYGASSPYTLRASLRFASLAVDGQPSSATSDLLNTLEAATIKTFGPSSFDAGKFHQLRAKQALHDGNLKTAQHRQTSALAILAQQLPPNSPDLATAHALLAHILERQGDLANAFHHASTAARIEQTRAHVARLHKFSGSQHAFASQQNIPDQALRVALRYASTLNDPTKPLSAALTYAESIITGPTRNALALSLIKAQAPSGPTRAMLEQQTTLLRHAEFLDQQYVSALQSRQRTTLAQQIQANSNQLQKIDDDLKRTLPAYANFIAPHAISLARVQQTLRARELLLVIIPTPASTQIIAITKSSAKWHSASITRAELETNIATLRKQLDPSQWTASFEPFNRKLAHDLYNALLSPVESLLQVTDKILLVTDAPISSLPLAVLINKLDDDNRAANSSPSALQKTNWLAKTHAITLLPSIAILETIRTQAPPTNTRLDFIGIGAPITEKSSPFPPLKYAARELEHLARLHKTSKILAGTNATKSSVTNTDLAHANVISFATHTVPAGALNNDEPGLLLSPTGGPAESNLLTVSDIMRLRLNADWIILSACNTAGEGGPQTHSIANAFLQAGARSLLVSHWPVSDSKSARLIVGTLSHYRKALKQNQAEALRLAMMDLMNDPSHPLNAHPSSWAAFSLLGEAR